MNRLGIGGTGLVGGSLARALQSQFDLVLWDRDEKTRLALQGQGFTLLEPDIFASQVDAVVLAVPAGQTAAVARQLLQAGAPAVFATASIQEPAASAIQDSRYLGLNPLIESTTGGWSSSRKKLLQGIPWALVAQNPNKQDFFLAMEIVDALQGSVLAIEPKEHDQVLAFTSQATQILQLALAALLADQPAYYHRLSGHSLRDMTSLAESDPEMWEDILAGNHDNISLVLQQLENEIKAARENLEEPRILWRHGKYGRESLLRYRWDGEQWRTRSLPWAHWWAGLLELGKRGALVKEPRDGGPLLYISSST